LSTHAASPPPFTRFEEVDPFLAHSQKAFLANRVSIGAIACSASAFPPAEEPGVPLYATGILVLKYRRLSEGQFVHASKSQGVIISPIDPIYWKRHFWTARRILTDDE
jgi:hypothetical protein